jgi:hypothetical protein
MVSTLFKGLGVYNPNLGGQKALVTYGRPIGNREDCPDPALIGSSDRSLRET